MSSYMVYDKSISQIADLVASVLNGGYNSTALSANEELHKSFNDCRVAGFINRKKVFDKLFALNLAAVNGRYKEDEELTGKYTDESLWTKPTYNYHFICVANHFQMLKTLQCFIYQCEEDINHDSLIIQGLKGLEATIKDLLISSMDLYNDAKWQ